MRSSNKKTRILLWIISILIITSMVCGFVASLVGNPSAPPPGMLMLPIVLGLLV